MTFSECYKYAYTRMKEAGISDARFDAYELSHFVFKLDRGQLIIRGSESPEEEDFIKFKELLNKRLQGVPLQYIIGEWDFYNSSFKVGEGVLIPRPETELLVDCSIEYLNALINKYKGEGIDYKPVVYDLCAGSGCVGISIAKRFPEVSVYEFEKSTDAYSYLRENIKLNETENVQPVLFDIFKDSGSLKAVSDIPMQADVIVSNPPYIKSEEINALQKEVQMEPRMALDGGKNGLIFYDAIVKNWMSCLKKGGLVAVECGEDQSSDIEKLFSTYGAMPFKVRDFAGIYRVVGAKIP